MQYAIMSWCNIERLYIDVRFKTYEHRDFIGDCTYTSPSLKEWQCMFISKELVIIVRTHTYE